MITQSHYFDEWVLNSVSGAKQTVAPSKMPQYKEQWRI
jgi:hypothetical protein